MRRTGPTEFYRGKRVLVTGASGFLASRLVRALGSTKCHIRRLSRSAGSLPLVEGAAVVEDMSGDITAAGAWEPALEKIDFVFHFAAQTGVYEANNDPIADLAVNVMPMLHMLETCRRKDRHPTVLFAGTVTQAGLTDCLPVDEYHADNPVTVYDLHKLMAENYLKYYARGGVVTGTSLRLANVYGPGPGSGNCGRGVLNSMIIKALEGKTLTIYGQGNHLRDYVYVDNVVEAFLEAGAYCQRLNGRHYVIGSGRGHTIEEMIRAIADRVREKTGFCASVVHVDPPVAVAPIEERDFVAESKAFSSATGWTANTLLVEGIDLTIDFFRDRIKEVA